MLKPKPQIVYDSRTKPCTSFELQISNDKIAHIIAKLPDNFTKTDLEKLVDKLIQVHSLRCNICTKTSRVCSTMNILINIEGLFF